MSENPLSYSSGNQTSKPSNLKPAISAALASLEVQLDEELARYRRTRISHRTPIQKGLDSLIAGKLQAQSAITLANTQLQQQKLTGEQAAAYIKQQQASNSQAKTQTPPPPPIPETFPRVGTKKEEINSQTQQIYGEEQTIPSSLNQSSIVKADINPNRQNENLSPSNHTTTKQPDDYLESSEALLRSLAEEQPQPQKPKTRNDSLLSPLSIGSMLLLLVSSITFGYIIFNFDNLPPLTIGSLFKRNSENNSSNNTDNVSSVEPDEIELTPIPKNPNLAADALPDINSIDDVAGATPKAQPTQAASPVPAVPATTVKQVAPTVTENTPREPVEQPEATATPQNLDEIKPSNGGFYNVIVDNTDDTLAQVRKVIPDAYVSPEGKYVYLGAFKSKERVKQHLELLKENGITARVEQPN
ncbi:MAG: hypothetical protein HC907_11840 [Richelia sp. SM1_7_0]|nr:hypothetical protein [Richelia sp. SM1_7_0]